jgi:arylesterase / paraoxonase
MRSIIVVLVLLMATIIGYVVYLAHDAGEFRTVTTLHPGECRQIPGMPGSEDITIHPSGQFAYVSSDDRRLVISGNARPGAIFRYDLNTFSAPPINLTRNADERFRPHGISLYVDDAGRETLFVVNHPGESLSPAQESAEAGPLHSIEVFDITNDELVHRRTIVDDSLVSPNDIVAVDHDRFYVTNDHGSQSGFTRQLEDYLRLPWANVVYFDGTSFRLVADRLSYANGINISPTGSRVYVAEVTRNRIREYLRDPVSGELEHLRRINLGFGADNIEVDPRTGDLWIGGHAKLLTFIRHASDASVHSPSQVARVQINESGYQVSTVFADPGELISGASVGAWHNGRLLIGSVFEDHIVDCAQ